MAENFGLVRKSMRPKLVRKSYFTPEGKVALMFLKIQQLQDILAEQWKPYMQNLDTMYTDATCYESEMMYPTDLMNAPCRGAMMCDWFLSFRSIFLMGVPSLNSLMIALRESLFFLPYLCGFIFLFHKDTLVNSKQPSWRRLQLALVQLRYVVHLKVIQMVHFKLSQTVHFIPLWLVHFDVIRVVHPFRCYQLCDPALHGLQINSPWVKYCWYFSGQFLAITSTCDIRHKQGVFFLISKTNSR